MPVIRPGDSDEDIGYEEYLKGTEEYFKQKRETTKQKAERASKIRSRIRRGRLGRRKDRVGRVAEAKRLRELGKEYKEREETLSEKDIAEYAEAEEARPVYSGRGGIAHRGVLAKWIGKYKGVLGRGTERYEKETSFLEGQRSSIRSGIVKEEASPFGVGRDTTDILSNPDYEVVESYETGEPKKVVQKSKEYVSRRIRDRRRPYEYIYSNYIPYEAELNKDGTIKKELNREIAETKWSVSSDNRGYNTYAPMVKGELSYKEGIPKDLIGRSTYRKEFYQSPKTIRTYSDYAPYESSRVSFTDEGEILDKKIFDIGREGSHGIGKWGGRFTRVPYQKEFYEYEKGEKTTYPKPVERETKTGKYYVELAKKNKPPIRKEVAWYNPYTRKGKTGTGDFYKTVGPKISKLGGPSYAIESPKTGKMISWKMHPFTEKPFKSGQDFSQFWKKREGMVGTTIKRQELFREVRKEDEVIPPSYWGTSSERFGRVSPGGIIEKLPAELMFGKYFWKGKKR